MNLPSKAELTETSRAQIAETLAEIAKIKRQIDSSGLGNRTQQALFDRKNRLFKRISKILGLNSNHPNRHNLTVNWLDKNYQDWRGFPNPAVKTSSRWVA